MNEAILFVDDENAILRALNRAFFGSGYEVLTAGSGEEALEILQRKKIDLLVTDVKMQGMDGFQLLTQVKEKYPSTIRLVLSGHVDKNMLLKIQQSCLAKHYLFKPWQNKDLLRTIEQIFEVEKILKNRNLLEVINKIEFLPSPQNVFNKFNFLIEQDAGMKEIAKTIESDPSITAKVLQVANSSHLGVKTGSVIQAINYLGLTDVKNIVLSACLHQETKGEKNARYHRDIAMLWLHAVTTNTILNVFYQKIHHKKMPESSSMAGLLHDVGKVVLLNNFWYEYMRAVEKNVGNRDLFHYYEQIEFTDISHGEIGGHLLDWWELPYSIVESALFHHCPLDERVIDKEMVALVHLADIYSWKSIYKPESVNVDLQVLDFLGINKDDPDRFLDEAGIRHPM